MSNHQPIVVIGTILSALWFPPIALAQAPGVAPVPLVVERDREGKPASDPTALTTQLVNATIIQLKELIAVQFEPIKSLIAANKKTLDEWPDKVELRMVASKQQIDIERIALQKLVEEKFKGVSDQFASRDVALAAALLAQKTSVDEQNKSNALSVAKSEAATTKQIDSITTQIVAAQRATADQIDGVKTLIAANNKATDDKIASVKESLSNTSGKAEGGDKIIYYFIAAGGLLVGVLGYINKQRPAPGEMKLDHFDLAELASYRADRRNGSSKGA